MGLRRVFFWTSGAELRVSPGEALGHQGRWQSPHASKACMLLIRRQFMITPTLNFAYYDLWRMPHL